MARRLTSNQEEVLHTVATGTVSGRLFASVPSLEKRGLIVGKVEKTWCPPQFGMGGGYRELKVYRLTPEGLETYKKLRAKWYEAEKARVDKEYEADLRRAQGKTQKGPDDDT